MAIYDFKCDNVECGFVDEFIVSPSVVDPVPEVCPKCSKGKLERQVGCSNVGIDVIGGYEYVYGKKNWKRGKTDSQIADCLTPDRNTGKYADPY